MGKVCDVCGGKHYAKNKCIYHYKMPSKLNPKPINKVSAKQAKVNAAYAKINKKFKEGEHECEGGFPGCTFLATESHHSLGRGVKYMLDTSTYKRLCHNCHEHVGRHHNEAVARGLSGSRLSNQSI